MKAMKGMNGEMLDHKPLYVALAQPAEERKARFEARWGRNMGKGPQPMYQLPPMGPPHRPMVFNQMMHPGWNQPIHMRQGAPMQMNYALMPAANRGGGPPRRVGRGGNRVNQANRAQGQNFKYAENVRNTR